MLDIYTIHVIPSKIETSAIAVILGGVDWAEDIAARLPEDMSAAFVGGIDWNGDLSPWAAPRAFKGEQDFSGGAEAFLDRLTGRVIPEIGNQTQSGAPMILVGYSLAGLFAAWAATKTERFQAIASVSGSLWFDGFREYLQYHPLLCRAAYFSVGDKEKNTRNARMARVEENTKKAAEKAALDGCETIFTLNPGNHFTDVGKRVADGVIWCRDALGKQRR